MLRKLRNFTIPVTGYIVASDLFFTTLQWQDRRPHNRTVSVWDRQSDIVYPALTVSPNGRLLSPLRRQNGHSYSFARHESLASGPNRDEEVFTTPHYELDADHPGYVKKLDGFDNYRVTPRPDAPDPTAGAVWMQTWREANLYRGVYGIIDRWLRN